MLYPFTLKKGTNIYGIIFGASHPRAVDKFLKIVWDKDQVSGEANFDIHDDIEKTEQPQLIGIGSSLKTKKEIFSTNLEDKILNGEIKTNDDAYNYALKEGLLGQHAAETIKKLKKEGKISYEGTSPLVTYENVYKDKKQINYKVIKK